jgi:immunity protein 44 of polymorphic toxin system
MELFFSAEVDAQVGDAWNRVAKPLETQLNATIQSRDYGPAVTSIALIPMILRAEWVAGHRERRLWKRAEASADYRLWVPFEAFRDGTDQLRRLLLIQCLLETIQDLQRKAGARFDGGSLSEDVLRAADVTNAELAALPRWPG